MNRFSLIYSADFDFQVISILQCDTDTAWEIANNLYSTGQLYKHKIQHYDVEGFRNIDEMNKWILDNVGKSREDKNLLNANDIKQN